ncbi:MAG: phosphoribosylglycinamide formyltransferase [Lutisporaceae bacterium]
MSRLKIAVLISGGGSNLQALIDAVEQGNIKGKIAVVISDKENAYGLQRAKDNNIEAVAINKKSFDSKTNFDAEMSKQLRSRNVDLIILAGFLSILPMDIIKEYEGKIINIHPSLIPSFCGNGFYGEKVHKAVIEYGVKVSGATVHFVDEGTDTGAIILQQAVTVTDEDTAETLAAKVLVVEHWLIVKAVALFCDGKLTIQGRRVKIL